MQIISTSLPALTHIELFGPFLVRTDAWMNFLSSHPHLHTFRITQSPRFDLWCMRALVASCGKSLEALRLREVGKLDDGFLEEIQRIKGLKELDIAEPGASCSEEAVVELMSAIGGSLTKLDLSKHHSLTDEFLERGLKPYTRVLDALALSHLPELTDKGVADFFGTWENHPLMSMDMARNHELGSQALEAMMVHSGARLEVLIINGWKGVSEKALKTVGRLGTELRKVDVGWCREMDDFVVKDWMGMDRGVGCRRLKELKVWGCNRITARCPKKVWMFNPFRRAKQLRCELLVLFQKGIFIYGVESHTAL
jgi:DNA repair protein RAD7